MNKDNQKIIDKVYELCPELKKLEFGCLVKYDDEQKMRFIREENEENGYFNQYLKEDNITIFHVRSCDDRNKIIGKPITLAYVLRAMQSLDDNNPERHWVVNRWGEFLINRDGYPGMVVGRGKWDFSIEDNLELQLENPELIKLLKEIL